MQLQILKLLDKPNYNFQAKQKHASLFMPLANVAIERDLSKIDSAVAGDTFANLEKARKLMLERASNEK